MTVHKPQMARGRADGNGIQSEETKPENEDVFHSILYTVLPFIYNFP